MKNKHSSRLLLAVLMAALAIPLANIILFRGTGLLFLSDPLTYPDELAPILGFIFEFLSGAISLFPVLCLSYAVLVKVHAAMTICICVFSVPLINFAMLLEDALINGVAISFDGLKSAGLGCASVLISYLIVLLVLIPVKKLSKKAPLEMELISVRGLFSRGAVISTLVTVMLSAAIQAVETYVFVASYGAPDSISQVMELATPYMITAIGAFAAYIVGGTVIKRLERLRKSRAPRK